MLHNEAAYYRILQHLLLPKASNVNNENTGVQDRYNMNLYATAPNSFWSSSLGLFKIRLGETSKLPASNSSTNRCM